MNPPAKKSQPRRRCSQHSGEVQLATLALIIAAVTRDAAAWSVAILTVCLLAWVTWPSSMGGAGWTAAPLWAGEVSRWWIPVTMIVTAWIIWTSHRAKESYGRRILEA